MIKTLIELFYSTGLRLSEVTNLKTSSIDLINRKIKVLGKRNKERIIPIIDPLKNQLFKYQELKREIIEESENEFFFVDKKNLKLKNIYVYKLVNNYLNKVSTKSKRSPHMLRTVLPRIFLTTVLTSIVSKNFLDTHHLPLLKYIHIPVWKK